MPFTSAPPLPAPRPSGTGITCSTRISKRGNTFWLIFNEDAQKRYFGRSIIGEKADVRIGRGSDEGKMQITLGAGDFEVHKGMRGSATIKVGAWDLLPKDKRPAASGEPINFNERSMVLKLPSWAKPSSHDGKIAQEFSRGISAKRSA